MRGSSTGMRRGGHNGGWEGPGMGMHGVSIIYI